MPRDVLAPRSVACRALPTTELSWRDMLREMSRAICAIERRDAPPPRLAGAS